MTPVSKPVVELSGTIGAVLIIEQQTGISYTNQTGGTSCNQPCTEGVLIPLENDYIKRPRSLETDLSEYFRFASGTSGATSGISDADAGELDKILQNRKLLDWIAVNRVKLKESHEAWLHVNVKSDFPLLCHGFDLYPRRGIVTWENSD